MNSTTNTRAWCLAITALLGLVAARLDAIREAETLRDDVKFWKMQSERATEVIEGWKELAEFYHNPVDDYWPGLTREIWEKRQDLKSVQLNYFDGIRVINESPESIKRFNEAAEARLAGRTIKQITEDAELAAFKPVFDKNGGCIIRRVRGKLTSINSDSSPEEKQEFMDANERDWVCMKQGLLFAGGHHSHLLLRSLF